MRNGNHHKMKLSKFRLIVAEFGTVVRDSAGKIVGIFPTEDEAYEMLNSLSEEVEDEDV